MDLTGDVLDVAPRLLGARLRVGDVVVSISEVEAYRGADDPASHAFRGPRPHTRHLFEGPGILYCYRSYGIHVCANIVVGPVGLGWAVLLRAATVVDGLATAQARRPGVVDARLGRGPGCLAQALGLTLADSGRRLGTDALGLTPARRVARAVRSGPRVGVSLAADRPWRFWLAGDSSVSAYRRSPRAPNLAAADISAADISSAAGGGQDRRAEGRPR